MDLRGYIDVTEIDPRLLVQVAYSGSRPQGLGYLHAKGGGLDEETLNAIIARSEGEYRKGEINLDYVHGRSMKFHVRFENGRRYLDLDWYDHGREATKRLLRECQLPDVEARITKAEAEKDEKDREYDARQDKAARLLVGMVAERGGRAARDDFGKTYEMPENSPIVEALYYGVERASANGWITLSKGCREYSLTEAGKSLMTVAA